VAVDVKFGLIKRHIICLVVMYLYEEWKLFTYYKSVALECYKTGLTQCMFSEYLLHQSLVINQYL
jgi:hypothetical protein